MTTLPVITAAFTPAATTTSTASSASSANSNTTASATATANSTTTAKSNTDNTASTTDTSNNSDSPQGFAALLASQVNPQSSLDTSKTLAKLSSQILAKGQAVNKTTLTQAIAAGQSDGTLQLDDAQMSQLISAVNKLSPGTQSDPVLDTTALKSSLLTDKTDSKDDKASDATTLPVQALFAMLAAQPTQTTAATASASSAQLTDAAELNNKAAMTAVGLSTTAASLLSANDKTATSTTTTTVSDSKTDTVKTKTTATYSAQTVDNTSAALAASQVSAAATNAGASQDNAQSSQDGSAALQALAQSQSAASAVSTPVTQSLPTTSTTVTAPAVSALNAQLGSPEWQQALGQQVMMFSSQGKQTAELRLHPQDLGSIQISLKIEDNQAQIHFVSGHSQVRAAIESAMPELRTALADNGISLGQSSVGSDASQWQQANQQAGQQSSANQGSSASWAAFNSGSSVGSALPVSAAIQSLASGNSAVDIFA